MNTPEQISIALVDDHVLIRAGLSQLINKHEGLKVTLEASNGADLLKQLHEQSVDVVLLDIDMPVMDGKATLEILVKDHPDVKVIMLTVHDHNSFIVNMMEAGAHGYLLKDTQPEEVIRAIHSVMDNGLYFNDRVSRALLGKVSQPKSPHAELTQESLNQRELDVLSLICAEKTTREIADELFLSPKTIEGYRKSLLEKTGAKNVAGLVLYAMRYGLIH
jgi:DNA-binding NarL/FixJ family response regulator